MNLKPAPDRTVRQPERGHQIMPAAGADVPDTGPHAAYYRRRLRDGDLIPVAAPTRATPTAPAKPAKSKE